MTRSKPAANSVFIKLWLDVKHSTLNRYFAPWLIEPDVFQLPQLHKHFTVACNSKMTLRTYFYILTITSITSCDFKSADDYLKQGHDIGLTGNYKAAIPIFDKAIQKNPKLKEAYIQRGLCYENIQQDSLAINDYEKLLSFDPNNTTAYYYIGLCKYRHNKFQEAIKFYNKALITKGVSNPSDTSSVQIVLDLNKNGLLADQTAFDVASYEIYYERGLAYYLTQQMIGLCWLTANKKDKACEAFRQGAFYGDSLSTTQIQEVCK